jgi:hypothetical protein
MALHAARGKACASRHCSRVPWDLLSGANSLLRFPTQAGTAMSDSGGGDEDKDPTWVEVRDLDRTDMHLQGKYELWDYAAHTVVKSGDEMIIQTFKDRVETYEKGELTHIGTKPITMHMRLGESDFTWADLQSQMEMPVVIHNKHTATITKRVRKAAMTMHVINELSEEVDNSTDSYLMRVEMGPEDHS